MATISAHLPASTTPIRADRATAAARLAGATVRIDGRDVLHDVSLIIPAGQCLAVFGENGAGKSTLLRVLATLVRLHSGKVELFGRDDVGAASLRGRIGLIGHSLMLYRDLSARANLEFFGHAHGVTDPRRRAIELLDRLGLSERAEDPVRVLSRGMAQRVAIARAIMHAPDLLLADEPFTGLDAPTSDIVADFLREANQQGTTVIIAGHETLACRQLAHRAIVLKAGEVLDDTVVTRRDDFQSPASIGGAP